MVYRKNAQAEWCGWIVVAAGLTVILSSFQFWAIGVSLIGAALIVYDRVTRGAVRLIDDGDYLTHYDGRGIMTLRVPWHDVQDFVRQSYSDTTEHVLITKQGELRVSYLRDIERLEEKVLKTRAAKKSPGPLNPG